jgi:hypothetical protein
VEEAIRAARRRLFWASFRRAAATAFKDLSASTEEAPDRELFEGTLGDGLDAQPIPD